jgi:DnaJ family protein B protein 4
VRSVSLEDLYTGATKKLKISRLRKGQKDEKVVEVTIKKGWKPGTKITFPGEGDEEASGAEPADIQFVIAEKPHPRFRRDGMFATRRYWAPSRVLACVFACYC